jgi:uncharacterized membrane protein (UPF0127 family)
MRSLEGKERDAALVSKSKLIFNLTRGECLCVGELADRPLRRMRGLMGRRGLPAGEGLLISPAPAIHTAFMRFSIDAMFLDRDLRVLDIVERLRPWRFASERKARSVLELSAGECARRGVEVGDRLELRDRSPEHAQAEPSGRADPEPSGDRASAAADTSTLGLGVGELTRLAPLCVLVISPDRRFRTVMSLLLARRNCSVTATTNGTRVTECIEREGVDVVLIDASQLPPVATDVTVATVAEIARPVGVVLVADEARPSGDPRFALSGPPVVAKWGPFGELFEAIELVDARRGTLEDSRARG